MLEIMRNTFYILYQTFCGKDAEVANKHSIITLRYFHCGVECDVLCKKQYNKA